MLNEPTTSSELGEVLVVFNPASGGGRGGGVADLLKEELTARGLVVRSEPTSPGENIFASLDTSGARAVVLIGGDGTVNDAVNGLGDTSIPMAFVGMGTVNVFARELSLPRDPSRVADLVQEGRVARIPVFRVGDRRGILFAEAGWLGDACMHANATRSRSGRHGRLEFILGALRHGGSSFGRPLRVTFEDGDGQEKHLAMSNALANRVRIYGGSMPMPVLSRADQPLEEAAFDLIGYRSRTPLGNILLLVLANLRLLPLLRRPLEGLGLLFCGRGKRLVVESETPFGVHVDAESLERTRRMELEFTGESINVLVP